MESSLTDILRNIIDNQDSGIIVLDKNLKTILINNWIIEHAKLQNKNLKNQDIISIFPQIHEQRLHIVIKEALNLNRASILSQAIHHSPLPLYQDSKINGISSLMQQRITVKPLTLNTETYCLLQIFDLSSAVAKEYLLRATATNAKISREHAESLSKLKSEFVSTISHELRTPLTSISGATALILGGASGEISVEASNMLSIVQRNSDRLLNLINELLDVQKIESGIVNFDYQNNKLSPLILNCIEMNNSYAEKYNIEYKFIADQSDYDVFIDEQRISQVFLNILSNATKFSDSNSTVTIQLEKKNNRIRTAVTDNGPGISESFKHKIFTKFAQYDSKDSRTQGGSGLGLCICKSIIEHHNGEISYYNNTKGATFYFDLPLEKSDYPNEYS